MTVYCQAIGHGQNVVLLHGWGMHSGVWEGTADKLAKKYRVTLVDLPGHGRSDMPTDDYNLQSVSTQISEAIPQDAILLGWSLGGIIAMQLARDFPQRIAKLILVNSTAQFVQSQDWSEAMDRHVLDNFANSLIEDFATTIKQFLALQVGSAKGERKVLRQLQNQVLAARQPPLDALKGGLAILRDTNLRPYLTEIQCPVLLIFGQNDRLIPATVGAKMMGLLPVAQCHVIDKAGHAPFLSHPDEFLDCVTRFIDG